MLQRTEGERPTPDVGWLIEASFQSAQGPHYMCVTDVAGYHFEWRPDHHAALRFCREEDANRARDAIRELRPDLFPTVVPFPRAVEHMWG